MLRNIYLLVICSVASINSEGVPCLPRDYGRGGTVCVCNKDHCDTLPAIEQVEFGKYAVYTSNKDGLRFNKVVKEFEEFNGTYDTLVEIDSDVTYQTMHGWGAAFTDSAGIVTSSLDEQTKQHLVRGYFSKDGLEYSLCRVPIGGTDFSTHGYSYDDGEPDTNLTNFKLAPEDHMYKIPLIKAAQNLTEGRVQFFASVWTAPKWMKTNGEYYGVGFLKREMYQVWANYFIKFLDAYKNEGINFWGITTQNEPSLSYTPFTKINSIAWTPHQMSTWVSEHLGPTIRGSQYSNLKIMCLDDQRFFLQWVVNKLFSNNTTKDYIDGIAVHWYWNKITSATVQTAVHEKYPDKFIIATEACEGTSLFEDHVILGSWSRGENYAKDIIENVENWATGWIDWSFALDTSGGPTYIDNFVDAPVIVNQTAGEFYRQPMFYALAHFTKFVPSGSSRIYSKQSVDKLKVVSFNRPDEGVVVVVLNRGEDDLTVKIQDNKRGTLKLASSKHSINTIVYW